MLKKIFEELQKNPEHYTKSKEGKEFESRFEELLKTQGFNRLSKEDYKSLLKSLKKDVTEKDSSIYLENNYDNLALKKAFFVQPFGRQEYPDFLVFTDKNIIAIETKWTEGKNAKPVWNSNLPKSNGFYIFGSFGRRDITFFSGSLVLSENERKELIYFFDEIVKNIEQKFKEELKKKIENGIFSFNRGFNVYARRAYDQNKISSPNAEINFFSASDRKEIENETLRILKEFD